MAERLGIYVTTLVGRLFGVRDEEGQALVEYALILAMVAIVCVAALKLVGGSVSSMLNKVASDF